MKVEKEVIVYFEDDNRTRVMLDADGTVSIQTRINDVVS